MSRTTTRESPDVYLNPTGIIDSTDPRVVEYAADVLGGEDDTPVDKAVKLYLAVRDGIWYDPYVPFHRDEHYRASNVIKRGKGYCVYKASLLCALGRAVGIPSRIGLVDVRNHLTTPKLLSYTGTDVFACHGYVDFHLDGKWVKATPAFNAELCQKHNVPPLVFNGREDSLFQTYDHKKNKFMEYIHDHGIFADIPVELIVNRWKKVYGQDRVELWIKQFEEAEQG